MNQRQYGTPSPFTAAQPLSTSLVIGLSTGATVLLLGVTIFAIAFYFLRRRARHKARKKTAEIEVRSLISETARRNQKRDVSCSTPLSPLPPDHRASSNLRRIKGYLVLQRAPRTSYFLVWCCCACTACLRRFPDSAHSPVRALAFALVRSTCLHSTLPYLTPPSPCPMSFRLSLSVL